MQPPDFSYRKIKVRMGLLSGALGAAGSIAGGLLGGSSASKAAKKAANIAASQAWSDVQMGERAYEDTQPFRDLGTSSANRLSALLGLGYLPDVQRRYVPQNYNDPFFNETPAPYLGVGGGGTPGRTVVPGAGSMGISTTTGQQSVGAASGGTTADAARAASDEAMALFRTDPGYEFRMGEGLKAIDRGAAARGGLQSGAAIKAEQRYGEGLAAQEYDNYIKRLLTTAGFGPQATGQSIQAGLGFGQLANEAGLAAGNARGSAYAAQANAMNNGITGLVGSLGRINWNDPFGSGGWSWGSGNGYTGMMGVPSSTYQAGQGWF